MATRRRRSAQAKPKKGKETASQQILKFISECERAYHNAVALVDQLRAAAQASGYGWEDALEAERALGRMKQALQLVSWAKTVEEAKAAAHGVGATILTIQEAAERQKHTIAKEAAEELSRVTTQKR